LTILLAYRRLGQNRHPIVSFCLSDLKHRRHQLRRQPAPDSPSQHTLSRYILTQPGRQETVWILDSKALACMDGEVSDQQSLLQSFMTDLMMGNEVFKDLICSLISSAFTVD
jgi:hypothetical protein